MIKQYQQLVVDTANKYGVDPDLALRVVKQESGFNPNARSAAGAGGLMQLMPGTAKDLGLSDEDRFVPEKNVDAGMRYLSQQIKDFGDVGLGLAAYNAGPGNVRKAGNQIPQFKETQDYVARIMGGGTTRLPQKAPEQVAVVGDVQPFDEAGWNRESARLAAARQQEMADIARAKEGLASRSNIELPSQELNMPKMAKIDIPTVTLMSQEQLMGLGKRAVKGSPKLNFAV